MVVIFAVEKKRGNFKEPETYGVRYDGNKTLLKKKGGTRSTFFA